MIFKYIRDKQNRKIGVVLADLVDGVPFITWSLCHKNDRGKDKATNTNRALQIANERLSRTGTRMPITGNYDEWILRAVFEVPNSILPDVMDMRLRAKKYFQTEKTLEQ